MERSRLINLGVLAVDVFQQTNALVKTGNNSTAGASVKSVS